MKHLSDDDITKELEMLGQSFQPSLTQEEKLHRQIFQRNRNKKTFRIQSWLPTIVSLIVLFSVGTGTFVLFNNDYSFFAGDSSGKGEVITDVTASWNGLVISQNLRTSPTDYILTFKEHSLVIENNIYGGAYDPDMSEENKEKKLKRYKIKEGLLKEGEYNNYSINKKNDTYTIKVTGEQGFTYTLKKVAPRIFVGEEGIEYSTPIYLE